MKKLILTLILFSSCSPAIYKRGDLPAAKVPKEHAHTNKYIACLVLAGFFGVWISDNFNPDGK